MIRSNLIFEITKRGDLVFQGPMDLAVMWIAGKEKLRIDKSTDYSTRIENLRTNKLIVSGCTEDVFIWLCARYNYKYKVIDVIEQSKVSILTDGKNTSEYASEREALLALAGKLRYKVSFTK